MFDKKIGAIDFVGKLQSGSKQLNTVSIKLNDSLNKIKDGIQQLTSGITKAHLSIHATTKTTKEKLDQMAHIDDFANSAISLDVINIRNIPNYGTVFGAYFISLSLCIGTLVILISMYYDSKKRFAIFDQNYPNKYKQFLAYIELILIQAFLLSILISSTFYLKILISQYYLQV